MLKKFNEYFKNLIMDRTEEIGQKILLNNKRYRELNTRIIEAQNALLENLPPQSKSLVFNYDEAESEQDDIVIMTTYRQGLIDGLRYAKLLDKTGTTQEKQTLTPSMAMSK
jgi:uncharacterized protein YyaL (SSP411 family)